MEHLDVGKLLRFSQDIEEQLYKENPMTFVDESAVNLRDLNRLLKLYRRFLEETEGDQDLSLAHCIDICYL